MIKKVKLLKKDSQLSELHQKDKMLLNFSYSNLYAQRLESLFTKCHDAVWEILKSEENIKTLLAAFRLSSFLWRIRGQDSLEEKYLFELKNMNLDEIKHIADKNLKIDLSYLERRIHQKQLKY